MIQLPCRIKGLEEGRLILEDSSHRHRKDKVQGKEGLYGERTGVSFLS